MDNTHNQHVDNLLKNIHINSNTASQVAAAACALRAGDVLAYPTESVWGLGCDPLNQAAFMRLLALKQRPLDKGVILVAHNIALLKPFVGNLPAQTLEHMQHAWQAQQATKQATTFVVPKHPSAPAWLTGVHERIAVRVSPHPLIAQLCSTFGSGLVSTSCNPSGSTPAKTLVQAQDYFNGAVSYLAGDTLRFDKPSRIIDCCSGAVLR